MFSAERKACFVLLGLLQSSIESSEDESCALHQGRLIERSKGRGTKLCVAVRMEQKQTAMHYQPVKKRLFLKVVLATPTMVTQARGESVSHALLLRSCLPCLLLDNTAGGHLLYRMHRNSGARCLHRVPQHVPDLYDL